ncbi:MAG: hypothetical protein SFX74_13510 [Fimbriimonadaceae bacterium]|nr:hypothetical protein [Fimbriimonadaceae bacterium]
MISDDAIRLLANPLEPDRPPLRREGDLLICTKTGVGFPIIDGIPRLLPEHVIAADEVARRLESHRSNGLPTEDNPPA